MKKYIVLLAVISFIMTLGCSQNEIENISIDNTNEPNVINFSATVPTPSPTRATLSETIDNGAKVLRFEWETGDKIQVAFVQGDIKKVEEASVTSVSADKRGADFTVAIPNGITSDFTLYAYYGAGLLDEDDPAIVTLPDPTDFVTNLDNQVNLLSMWDKKAVTYDGTTSSEVSLTFKHLGSIMSLEVENSGTTAITDFASITLNGTSNWLYNESGQAKFDMASGIFETESEGAGLSINTFGTIAAGESVVFHRWFVPGGVFDPTNKLSLSAIDSGDNVVGSSGDETISPKVAFQPGWNYGLHITVNTDQTPSMKFTTLFKSSIIPIIKGFTTNNTVSSTKPVTRQGVVFSETNNEPTISNSDYVEVGSVNGNNFSLDITGLKPFTSYYIVPFVEDEEGIKYGEIQKVRSGTYGSKTNTLILVEPPTSYLMGWTSETDGTKDANLFVNNSEANGNCLAQDIAPFMINKYPVTSQEYCDFLNEYGFTVSQLDIPYFSGKKLFNENYANFSQVGGEWIPDTGKENHPAVGINWAGANEFCIYYGGRLPDEAEWEIAARGGKYTDQEGKTTYSGSNTLSECGWYSDNSGTPKITHPVGELTPNGLGIYDMSGNVYEWTDSWYQRYQTTWSHQKSLNPNSATYEKIIRGGSYNVGDFRCRSVYRLGVKHANNSIDIDPDVSQIGFRFIISKPADME